MGMRDHEYLPIARKEWIETTACLTQEALGTDNRAELLGPMVAHDPLGQASEPYAVAASQQNGPEAPRQRQDRYRDVRQVHHPARPTKAGVPLREKPWINNLCSSIAGGGRNSRTTTKA